MPKTTVKAAPKKGNTAKVEPPKDVQVREMGPKPPVQPNISHFTIAPEAIQLLGETITALTNNKYQRQALINAVNDSVKPVFEK